MSVAARSADEVEKAVTEILEQHRSLLECLVMSSAEKWVALDELISRTARNNHTTKRDVMIRIGLALEKENPEGYAKSLKVMISRAKAKPGTAKNSRDRKKGLEAILEKLEKMKFTNEELERLGALLERKRRELEHSVRQGQPTYLRPVQADVVNK